VAKVYGKCQLFNAYFSGFPTPHFWVIYTYMMYVCLSESVDYLCGLRLNAHGAKFTFICKCFI